MIYSSVKKSYSKGLGYKIITTFNGYLFNEFDAEQIILSPFSRNLKAIKCYRKAGYITESEYLGMDTIGQPEMISVMCKTLK